MVNLPMEALQRGALSIQLNMLWEDLHLVLTFCVYVCMCVCVCVCVCVFACVYIVCYYMCVYGGGGGERVG